MKILIKSLRVQVRINGDMARWKDENVFKKLLPP